MYTIIMRKREKEGDINGVWSDPPSMTNDKADDVAMGDVASCAKKKIVDGDAVDITMPDVINEIFTDFAAEDGMPDVF